MALIPTKSPRVVRSFAITVDDAVSAAAMLTALVARAAAGKGA